MRQTGLLVLACLAACQGADADGTAPGRSAGAGDVGVADGCVESFEAGRDYFPEKAQLRHAQGFSVSYHGHYKVLRTHPPAEAGGGEDVLVLVQCGTPSPPLEGALTGASVVEIPVRTTAANEDLSLTRIRLVDGVEGVIGVGSGGIYDSDLRARWERRDALEIGASFHGPPYYERLLEMVPDMTFLSTASLTRAEALRRARELGLPAAPSVSWVEPTLLAQAEWLQQVAVFFNAEGVANELLDAIEVRYEQLARDVAERDRRPLVLWLDPSGQGNRWTVPEASWKARAVVDAGGRTPFGDPVGQPTRDITSEEILALGDSIDLVITESVALDVPGSAGALETLAAFREGRVYSVHARSRPEHDAYDWYESAVVEVDRVLEDLVALVHPDLLPDHILYHLRPARGSAATGRAGAP